MIRIKSYAKSKSGTSVGGITITPSTPSTPTTSTTVVVDGLEPHTLWGQTFDGTQDVDGDMTNVGNLTMSGTAYIGSGANVSGDVTVTSGCVNTPCLSATNITATSGVISNMSANTISTTSLSAISGYIQSLFATDAVIDSLTVTKAAHFFKLVIDEVRSTQGQILVSPSNGLIDYVETYTNTQYGDKVYVCHIRRNEGNKAIYGTFEIGDLVVCQTLNLASGTTSYSGNRFYWMPCVDTGETETLVDGETIKYFDVYLLDDDKESHSNATPQSGDTIVTLGNLNDEERQNAIIISSYQPAYLDSTIVAPAIVQYNGIDDYNLASHRVNVISAELNSFNVNGTLYENGVEIGSAITNINQDLSSVTTTVSSHTQTLSAHTSELSQLEVSVSGIEATVSSHTQSISSNTEDISQLQVDVSGISSTVESLQTDLTNAWAMPLQGWTSSSTGSSVEYGNNQTYVFDSNEDLFSPIVYVTKGATARLEVYLSNTSSDFSWCYSTQAYDTAYDVYYHGTTSVITLTRSDIKDAGNKYMYYATFTASTDCYLCVNVVSNDILYRPQLLMAKGYSTKSEINQTAGELNLSVKKDLRDTGINITDGTIKLKADKVTFSDSNGTNTDKITIDPTDGTLTAINGTFKGSGNGFEIELNGQDRLLTLTGPTAVVSPSDPTPSDDSEDVQMISLGNIRTTNTAIGDGYKIASRINVYSPNTIDNLSGLRTSLDSIWGFQMYQVNNTTGTETCVGEFNQQQITMPYKILILNPSSIPNTRAQAAVGQIYIDPTTETLKVRLS